MSFLDQLKGYQPIVNEDKGGFEIIKGDYLAEITALKPKKNKEGVEDRYELTLTIRENLKGQDATNRNLWRSYFKDGENSIKDLMNDLFTMNVNLDNTADEQAFENSFLAAIGAKGTIRAWGWTPDKDREGNAIPVEERTTRQMFKIVNPAKAKKQEKAPF